MTREELLSRARQELWAGWVLSADEIGAAGAATLLHVGMLVEPGGAQELEQLRVKVAELESQLAALTAQQKALRERSTDSSADRLTRLLAPTQALLEDPHDSPLHHDYLVGRDLPEPGGAK